MATKDRTPIDPIQWQALSADVLCATADNIDKDLGECVTEVLGMLRNYLDMDAVFVTEFEHSRRLTRYVNVDPDHPVVAVGDDVPLEQTWCQRVVDGRMPKLVPDVSKLPNKEELPAVPFPVGTFISTPVYRADGCLYGTLCALSFSPVEAIQKNDLANLEAVASTLAHYLKPSAN